MKLYEFLFEQPEEQQSSSPEEKPSKPQNSFNAPRFALMWNKDPTEKTLILYDTVELARLAKENDSLYGGGGDYWLALAAMITVRESDEGCLGALQVAYVASNPKQEYKGAGGLIYALASKVFGKPLTSDRAASTSKSGQRNWDRMTSTGKMEKVQSLDNFHITNSLEKEYVKVNPDRSFEVQPGPQTPDEFDDCELGGGVGLSAAKAVGYTGTFDTWKSTLPINPTPLLRRHDEFMDETNRVTEWQLIQASETLFRNRYKGSSG
jgi:hypothetical protein